MYHIDKFLDIKALKVKFDVLTFIFHGACYICACSLFS